MEERPRRRDSEYIGRRMLNLELLSRRQRRRPKREFMDAEDIQAGHAYSWCERRSRGQIKMQEDDSLWQLKHNLCRIEVGLQYWV